MSKTIMKKYNNTPEKKKPKSDIEKFESDKYNQLINEYEQQYQVLNGKIEGLKPLLSVYQGNDLYILRRRIKLYYNMACECKKIAFLLRSYSKDEISKKEA